MTMTPPAALPTRIGIIGSAGRMGRAIAEHIADHSTGVDFCLVGGIDRDGDVTALARICDVLIDFSSPQALEANLYAGCHVPCAMVIGTTGLDDQHHALIDQASQTIAVLQTSNTSLGVNMLASLVEEAARRLDPSWDIEISEIHHRFKRDAPSGTALLLGEAAARGRSVSLAQAAVRARDGISEERAEGSIGFSSLRGGSVAGDHEVHFLGQGERLVLSHIAENRAIFARGALQAARWIAGQRPGRYTMRDVL